VSLLHDVNGPPPRYLPSGPRVNPNPNPRVNYKYNLVVEERELLTRIKVSRSDAVASRVPSVVSAMQEEVYV